MDQKQVPIINPVEPILISMLIELLKEVKKLRSELKQATEKP